MSMPKMLWHKIRFTEKSFLIAVSFIWTQKVNPLKRQVKVSFLLMFVALSELIEFRFLGFLQ